MSQQKLKEIQDVQLDLTKKFLKLCKQYGIECFAVYGTLLGAVRHKGFIPWDDDVDLAIWRKDLKKLKRIANKLPYPYKFIFSDNKADYYFGIVKFQNLESTNLDVNCISPEGYYGIHIDVEIIDYTFEIELFRNMKNAVLNFLYRAIAMKQYGNDYHMLNSWAPKTKRRMEKVLSFISREKLIKLVELVSASHGISKKNCSIYTYNQFDELRSSWFKYAKKAEFEDTQISIPRGYKQCLKSIYGEAYNEIPAIENQIPKHIGGRYVSASKSFRLTVDRVLNCFNIREGQKVILWGTGSMFEHYMDNFGVEYAPYCVIDNNAGLWNTEKLGCKICSPEVLKKFSPEEVHLIICNVYINQIEKQIQELGEYEYYLYTKEYMFNMFPGGGAM